MLLKSTFFPAFTTSSIISSTDSATMAFCLNVGFFAREKSDVSSLTLRSGFICFAIATIILNESPRFGSCETSISFLASMFARSFSRFVGSLSIAAKLD